MSQLATNITEVELVGKRNCTKFVVNNTTCYDNTVGYSINSAGNTKNSHYCSIVGKIQINKSH